MDIYDAVVIGAGFGGLGCALSLVAGGARVAVFETLRYPGGCASTFQRRGYRFESGATLFSGFGEGQLFAEWIDRFGLDVVFEKLDPVVEMRAPGFQLSIPPDRIRFIDQICALPDAPVERLRRFFAFQQTIADLLWELFDDPDLLPPFSAKTLLRHIQRTPRYMRLLPWVGQPLEKALRKFKLSQYQPLRVYLDAVCQITVQANTAEVEAPFAMASMDYYFRGTGHIRGGIGELAWALVEAIKKLGGEIFFTDRVHHLSPLKFSSALDRGTDLDTLAAYSDVQAAQGRHRGLWRVETRRRQVGAPFVVANMLPQALNSMLPNTLQDTARLNKLSKRVEKGWGAAMLYLGLAPEAKLSPEAHHLELIARDDRGLVEGNHVFCSISGLHEVDRTPPSNPGGRTATCSTHVPMSRLLKLPESDKAAYIEEIQDSMRKTLRARAPEVAEAIVDEMTASPRTYERFTGRPYGFVGGVPRQAGWHNYRYLFPTQPHSGLYLVGDSVFPGQSTLATALSGVKVAQRILQKT